jgi:hypothetical protein
MDNNALFIEYLVNKAKKANNITDNKNPVFELVNNLMMYGEVMPDKQLDEQSE